MSNELLKIAEPLLKEHEKFISDTNGITTTWKGSDIEMKEIRLLIEKLTEKLEKYIYKNYVRRERALND